MCDYHVYTIVDVYYLHLRVFTPVIGTLVGDCLNKVLSFPSNLNINSARVRHENEADSFPKPFI